VIERITAPDGQELAYIIRAQTAPSETTFLTPPELTLQVGFVAYRAGQEIPRHIHLPVERHIVGSMEVLLVRQGRCEVDIYTHAKQVVATRTLATGDVLVAVGGGHGFRVLEDLVLLEVKQGPYPGVAEKERF
jgi:hypothetical protein